MIWAFLAIGTPILFITSIRVGWAMWAVVFSGVLMGLVWVFTLWVLVALLAFIFAPRKKPMLKYAYG
ncbi:MAG: hypothetical protein ACI9J3_000093 [Parvicellaceae bacterium]|jgi:hypothetical protein